MIKKSFKKCILAVLFVFGSLLLMSCNGGTEMEVPELKEPAKVKLDTEIVTRGDLVEQEVFSGSLVPVSTEIYFELDGYIGSLNVYPGKWVEKGEVLMTLDSTSLENRIQAAEKNLEELDHLEAYELTMADLRIQYLQVELEEILAKEGESLNYQKKLLEIEEENLNNKHAQENRDRSRESYTTELENCRADIAKTELYAPHEGYIYFDSSITKGSYVRAGHSLVYVINANDFSLEADLYLTSQDMANNHVYALIDGRSYELELQELSYEDLLSMALSGITVVSSFKVIGEGSENLICGSYAELIKEKFHLTDVLLLPNNALKKDANGSYVYVISDEGREQRYVKTGKSNGIMTEIQEGLQEGEEVYVQD